MKDFVGSCTKRFETTEKVVCSQRSQNLIGVLGGQRDAARGHVTIGTISSTKGIQEWMILSLHEGGGEV